MPDEEGKVIKELVTKEPIPKPLEDFLHDYAEANRPNKDMETVRICIEHVREDVCVDKGSAVSEIRVLYKHREWVNKRKGE